MFSLILDVDAFGETMGQNMTSKVAPHTCLLMQLLVAHLVANI